MKRKGRPPLPEKDRKSEPVGLRFTSGLRAKLEKARRSRQGDIEPSLSQEIEIRLRKSFETERKITTPFGGPTTNTRQVDLRDYFASQVLPQVYTAALTDKYGPTTVHAIATKAYQIADAMLEARKRDQ